MAVLKQIVRQTIGGSINMSIVTYLESFISERELLRMVNRIDKSLDHGSASSSRRSSRDAFHEDTKEANESSPPLYSGS